MLMCSVLDISADVVVVVISTVSSVWWSRGMSGFGVISVIFR